MLSITPSMTNSKHRRHNDQIVVYDPRSKQLALRNTSTQGDLDLTECPYCHRPLRDDDRPRSREHDGTIPAVPAGFVSPEYFRMLHQSLLGSEDTGPPSPIRRLVQPARSRQTSGAVDQSDSGYIDVPVESPSSPSGISPSAFSPGYFERFFKQEKELGRGGKGVVLLVRHILDGVVLGQFACKRVPVGDDHEWLRKVLIEVQLLQQLSHQHLVSYRHVWLEDVKVSKFGPSVPCAFILQQYCNSGDLQHYVSNSAETSESSQSLRERARRHSRIHMSPTDIQGRKLQFEEIYSFFKDITSGLNHLHINGFIHRDLKPSNCLLHDTGQGLRVLVSDFGEVQFENMARKSTGATGTLSYCAPEVLQRDPTGRYGNFTPQSDIFSLGMILYFLCFARLPYRNANALDEDLDGDLDDLRDEITSWAGLHEERKLRTDLPEKLYTFLRRLLSLEAGDRPSAEDILLGIKTGSGLDEVIDSRPSSSSHMYDDLRNSSRISPVDSPVSRARSPMSPAPLRRTSTGFARPAAGFSRLRFDSSQAGHANGSAVDDSPPPTSPGGSLVLREKLPSSTRVSPVPQLALPTVNPENSSDNIRVPGTQRAIQLAIFLFKMVSVTTFCSPVAANPTIMYPLLALATADLLYQDPRLTITVSLLLLHIGAIWASWSRGVLCISKSIIWEGT